MKNLLLALKMILFLCGCNLINADGRNNAELENQLLTYIQGKDARIGLAVIIDDRDTVSVNGQKEYPMMSVFKFPLALAVALTIDLNGKSLDETVDICADDMKENTWSPMREKYGRESITLSIRELLEWSLKQSDNNAADILIKYVGGTENVSALMHDMNFPEEIVISVTEDDMHRVPFLCYRNLSTPIAMAELFNRFNRLYRNQSHTCSEIALMLEECNTGRDRLAAPFIGSGVIVGHKTGTGDSLVPGRISAINDCGYINLPNGMSYTIAVFVADSAYGMSETSAIIADISEIVYGHIR